MPATNTSFRQLEIKMRKHCAALRKEFNAIVRKEARGTATDAQTLRADKICDHLDRLNRMTEI